MGAEEDAARLRETDIDRAPLETYDATEPHQQKGRINQKLKSSDERPENRPEGNQSAVRTRFRHVTEKLQSKLHVKHTDESLVHENQRVLDNPGKAPILAPPASTARDDDHLFRPPPEKPSGPALKEAATSPVKTIKSALGRQGGNAYAENLAKTDVTHGANVNIVRAYDNLEKTTTATDRTSAIHDLEQLKKSRQDSFLRWTMDRHVQKVRRVDTIKLPRKTKREFVDKMDDGSDRMLWTEYGQYVCPLSLLLLLDSAGLSS